MPSKVGIRVEDAYRWEKRVPLVPEDAADLARRHGLRIAIQSSRKRVFTDEAYRAAGIEVVDDLASSAVIIGIKEIPPGVLEPGKTYVFFSHTIKGQSHNMPMLRRFLDLGATLIDYEKVTDEKGRRLIFFGNYAGLAGMIETLWALGQRLAWEGIKSPFQSLKRPYEYPDLAHAKAGIRAVGEQITREGLPKEIAPLVVGIAGYGNVSRGAQEILSLLPVRDVSPHGLLGLRKEKVDRHVVHKTLFKEVDTVEPVNPARPFHLEEFFSHPERYRGTFARFLPHLDIVLNCIYWDARYPRLVTLEALESAFRKGERFPRVIGDLSCDVGGAIECTVKATEPDVPVYVYEPLTGQATDGVAGKGPVIMAIDILPTELPREASVYFSGVLKPYIPAIASADYTGDFAACALPPEIKRAVIAYRGELTPDYAYLAKHLALEGEGKGEGR
jgi:alpha-aminoadipic semialdehyde synthase